MKKITNILCIAGMGMMLFSACETDRDDNPTYHDASTFTLKTGCTTWEPTIPYGSL